MTKRQKKPAFDFQQHVTNELVKQLEQGVKPWSRSWNVDGYNGLPMRHNGEFYRGFNVIWLSMWANIKGFRSGYWMTFRQASELGGNVKKGEKSIRVCKYGSWSKKVEMTNIQSGSVEEVEQGGMFLKSYAVFNANQIEGLPESYYAKPNPALNQNTGARIEKLENFFKAQLADIRHGGNAAYYNPIGDFIQMPEFARFRSPSAYYSTLSHECTHWTSPPHRLDRNFEKDGRNKTSVAREELVAEINASMFSAYFGYENEEREDHASYIASWLKALKNDKREIFRAAAHAQRAFDYLYERSVMHNIPHTGSSEELAKAA